MPILGRYGWGSCWWTPRRKNGRYWNKILIILENRVLSKKWVIYWATLTTIRLWSLQKRFGPCIKSWSCCSIWRISLLSWLLNWTTRRPPWVCWSSRKSTSKSLHINSLITWCSSIFKYTFVRWPSWSFTVGSRTFLSTIKRLFTIIHLSFCWILSNPDFVRLSRRIFSYFLLLSLVVGLNSNIHWGLILHHIRICNHLTMMPHPFIDTTVSPQHITISMFIIVEELSSIFVTICPCIYALSTFLIILILSLVNVYEAILKRFNPYSFTISESM